MTKAVVHNIVLEALMLQRDRASVITYKQSGRSGETNRNSLCSTALRTTRVRKMVIRSCLLTGYFSDFFTVSITPKMKGKVLMPRTVGKPTLKYQCQGCEP